MDKSIYFLFVFEPFPYTDRGFLLALSSINSQLWFKAQFRIRKTTIVVLLQYFVIFCQIFFYANSKLRIRKTTIVEFFEDLMCKSNPKAISPKYKTYCCNVFRVLNWVLGIFLKYHQYISSGNFYFWI